jgi:tRNA-specific 2-thiouridylase
MPGPDEQPTPRVEPVLDEHDRPVTALALMSGGLDSRLAARIMLEHGVRVVALTFDSVFCHARPGGPDETPTEQACRALGIPLEIVPFTDELIPLVKHPPHGHGKQMNPCIDCRIAQFRLARRAMDTLGAHFFVTGEVVGQRPMSQRLKAMLSIAREAGVEALVLRPLSAKLLPPTMPEQKGWVDRSALYAFRGRSRKPQMELAARLGLTDYPGSAGGCLLTDEGFADKVRDVIEHAPDAAERDFELLKIGRHFRLPSGAKAIVGRDKGDNDRLEAIALPGELLLWRHDTTGPTVLLQGTHADQDRNLAAALCVSHSKLAGAAFGIVRYNDKGNEPAAAALTQADPLDRATIDRLRI